MQYYIHLQGDIESTKIQYQPVNAMLHSFTGRYCLAIPLNVGMIFTNIHHKKMTAFTLLPSKLFASNKYFINISLHLQVDIESTKIQYQPVNAILLMKGGGY